MRLDQAVTSTVNAAISKGRLLLCETGVSLQETSLPDSELQYFHLYNSGVNCLKSIILFANKNDDVGLDPKKEVPLVSQGRRREKEPGYDLVLIKQVLTKLKLKRKRN